MKYLHLMVNEKFTKRVSGFYNHFFCDGSHEILYYRSSEESSLINKDLNIKQYEYVYKNKLDTFKFIRYLDRLSFDYLILHSIRFGTAQQFLLLLNKSLLQRIVWIEWGFDLYSWERKNHTIWSAIRNRICYKFRNSIKYFVAIFPPDIQYYCKNFPNSNAKTYCATYLGFPIQRKEYNPVSKLEEAINNKEPIIIQVGHSAKPSLNHIEVLEKLSKYRNENIRIFLPLSYAGTRDYVEKVASAAERLFPHKCIILRDFMPLDEYKKLLNSVSIAIFNIQRQCGLGNIHTLNFSNVKVYLREDSSMYQFFIEQGVPVCKYEDISDMDFEEFIRPVHTENEKNFNEYINERTYPSKAISDWKNIYSSLEDSLYEQ